MTDCVHILGVPFAKLNRTQLASEIQSTLSSGRKTRIAFANPEFCVVAQRDAVLMRYLQTCDYCLADGVGILWAAKYLGSQLPERIPGTEFIYELSSILESQSLTLFLYGGAPGVADDAACQLRKLYPTLEIVGAEHGYQDNGLNSKLVKKIQRLEPDVVMVCLGNPIQERWIQDTFDSLPVKLVFGNGGALDFTAGRVSRAPSFFISIGAEWLWRFTQDFTMHRAGRLMRLPQFVFMVLKQRLKRPN